MSLLNGPKNISTKLPVSENPITKALKSKAMMGIHTLENVTGIRMDPVPAYMFYLDISGVIVGLFTQCSGIGARREVETVIEGGQNDHAHQLPGRIQFENIVLSRGLSTSQELWKWFEKGKYQFDVQRVNLTIYQGGPGMNLLGAVGLAGGGYGIVKQWNVEGAYPVSWKLSPLDVNNTSSTAIETLEIAHAGITLSQVFGTPMFAVGSLIK